MEPVTETQASETISEQTQRYLCEAIIKDAITELQIYGKLHKLPKLATGDDYEKFLEEKFETAADFSTEEGLIRVQEARTYLEYMLGKLLVDSGGFERLISEHEKRMREEENLLGGIKDLCEKQKRLQGEAERAGVLMCNAKDEEIGKLKDEYENLLHEWKIKEEYIRKWEESKREQLEVELERKEKALRDTIRDFRNRIEREKRVHQEIEAYDNAVIQDHNDAIAHWSQKYEQDLKSLDKKIALKKNARLCQQMKITAIRAMFKERQKEMDSYRKLKEAERQKLEEIARINGQATKIQAWWRGVMVRRKLGPYKVKKPKAKGKGKSGKST